MEIWSLALENNIDTETLDFRKWEPQFQTLL